MPALGLPQLSVDPVLWLPLWLGTLRDYSGYGHVGTIVDSPYWTQHGGTDEIYTARVSAGLQFAHADSLSVGSMSFFAWGHFSEQVAAGNVFRKLGAGTRYQLQTKTSTQLSLYNGAVFSTANISVLGAMSVGMTFVNGSKPRFFIDGVFAGLGGSNITISPTNDVAQLGASGTSIGSYGGVTLYPGPVLDNEIAALHAYSQSRITPRRQWPGSGLRYPDRETNRVTPTPAGAWTANGTNIVSDITDGIKVEYVATANPAVTQVALVNGTQYEIRGEVISDGAHVFNVTDNGATTFGTMMTSTAWQDFLFIGRASASSLILQGMAITTDFSVRNLKVWTRPPGYTHRSGDPTYLDNIQTARVTLVDQTSGRLSNTPYQIESGQWRVDEDATTGERYIECVVAGIISRRNLFAYGTWEFDLYHGVGAGVDSNINIIGSSVESLPAAGYQFRVDSTEAITIRRTVSGGVAATKSVSSTGYIDPETKYKIRITRSPAGLMTAYIFGAGFVEWTIIDSSVAGANPFTDAATTSSIYVSHDLDAGDRLYYDVQFAGVLAPI